MANRSSPADRRTSTRMPSSPTAHATASFDSPASRMASSSKPAVPWNGRPPLLTHDPAGNRPHRPGVADGESKSRQTIDLLEEWADASDDEREPATQLFGPNHYQTLFEASRHEFLVNDKDKARPPQRHELKRAEPFDFVLGHPLMVLHEDRQFEADVEDTGGLPRGIGTPSDESSPSARSITPRTRL